MTELQRDLVALFERKAAEMESVPLVPPKDLRKRTLLRETRFVASVAAMLAVLAGSTFGAVLLTRGEGSGRPADVGRSAITRLSTAEVTVTYPRAWWAVALTGDGATYVGDRDTGSVAVLPILQVSNFAPTPSAGPRCPLRTAADAFPENGVLLYVEQVLRTEGGALVPDATLPLVISGPSGDPCRGGLPMRPPAARRPVEALLVAGPKATAADLASLVRAFRDMEVDPTYEFPNTLVVPTGPKLIALQGVFAGQPWRVLSQATDSGPCVGLTYSGGVAAPPRGSRSSLTPIRGDCPSQGPGSEGVVAFRERYRRPDGGIITFVWGLVSSRAENLKVEMNGRVTDYLVDYVPAEAVEDREPFVVFAAVVSGEVDTATATALDGSGNVIGIAELVCRPTIQCG